MFDKVLIANRGEIALRVQRACIEMGIKTVAIHSTADADAMHVRLADESVCIGPPAKDSYLNRAAIISAATITNADAIHPGYGFLSENAAFAEMVEDHGITFIGPSPEHIRIMGDKVIAKATAKEAGIPVVPGSDGAVESADAAAALAEEIGYPVLIKASAGGGGRGMKVAQNASEIREAFQVATTEAKAAFGNGEVYMEKYLSHPRHIEIQVLGDKHGNVVHLGERDCSLQRKHQKIFEECPSPALNATQRAEIGEIVCAAMRKIGYYNAGTVEFLYEDGRFYFIEMNTRLQVEHPITEMITGLDLVREQIRVAAGMELGFGQSDIQFQGCAMECRINAENPRTFAPSPGTITGYHSPGGRRVRVDSAMYAGSRVPPHYDSLISKLIVQANGRNEAIMRMRRALREYVIDGIQTTIPLHQAVLEQQNLIDGSYDIRWLENFVAEWVKKAPHKRRPGVHAGEGCFSAEFGGMTDITPDLVLKAYAYGVFPMARSRRDPAVVWVQPKLRGIIPLDAFHVPRSLRKRLRRAEYMVTVDQDFGGVMAGCAAPAPGRDETWINDKIADLFTDLHRAGLAHSVEVWRDAELVGGLYGLAMGGAFFGESMFSFADDASKVALCHLVAILKAGGFSLLDTQFITDHLKQFGAIEIPQRDYLLLLSAALADRGEFGQPLSPGELDATLFSQRKTQTS